MKLTKTTWATSLTKAIGEGEPDSLPGAFELHFDNGVVWVVQLPNGSTREDWDEQFELVTKQLGGVR